MLGNSVTWNLVMALRAIACVPTHLNTQTFVHLVHPHEAVL